MGIHGIYKEIGPGDRIALLKLAVEKFEQAGRPLRIAIDTSIWLFQIQSSKGGTNPALRTFYYRLLRLLSHSIHPLFVFDGPNKPPFKRNKRTGPNVASIPEFLAKQLLKQFGFPFHIAPGEAEAECALLQREGIVDAVLSEDVDTLMFGSRISLRNWSPNQKSSKVPTHVNVYDAERTKAGPSGLDREGMILVALMSGGDYLPEGIPGCGPKIACEAARAGFGSRLCAIAKRDTAAIQEWREDLARELRTNESKFFKRKHGALAIPEDFPRADILSYYINPAISSRDGLERLRRNLRWDQDLNFPELRTFTADAFDWVKVTGAKKFIRNLAPALLVRNLRMRGQAAADGSLPDEPEIAEAEEAKLVMSIHGKRQHPSTDNTTELRIAFSPIGIVNIDLDAEEPDDEPEEGEDEDEDEVLGDGDDEAPKKRGPYLYDPTKLEKIWISETFVKVGTPLTVQDWEEAQRKKTAPKPAKVTKPRAARKAAGGMQRGTLNQFAKITKAGVAPPSAKRRSPSVDRLDLSAPSETRKTPSDFPTASSDQGRRKPSVAPKSPPQTTKEPVYIDILSSSPVAPRKELGPHSETLDEHYLSPNVTKRVRTLRRSQTAPGGCADAVPSQSAAVPDGSQTSPMAGDLLTSSVLDPIRELESLPQLSQVQKPTRTRGGLSQARRPSTPSKRQQRHRASNDVSPSKRQVTLEESFGFLKSGTPSKTRRGNLLEAPEKEVSAFVHSVEEVEELDLSHSSPPVIRGKAAQELLSSRAQTSSQLSRRPSEEVSGRATCTGARSSGDRALRATSGNRARCAKATEVTRRSEKASSTTASRLASLEMSPRLRRSPRQHRTSPSPIPLRTGETAPELRRSPRHHCTSIAEGEVPIGTATNLTSPPRQSSTAGGIFGNTATKIDKKQMIKVRQSLEGGWKLVDASSVDDSDMTGDVPSQNWGGGQRADGRSRRRAWRQSEVEVLDLTNG